ncbi:MAG: hypothetical protein ACREOI_29235 [bacterium]
MKKSWYILTLAVLLCNLGYLHGQKFTRENYFDFLPPSSHIIRQTAASARLHLYGNPLDLNYQDASPADGIDDERAKRLLALAAKFSPILHKHNFSVPRDFEAMLRLKYDDEHNKLTYDNRPFLYVDIWDLTKPESQLVIADFVDLAAAASLPGASNGEAARNRNYAKCHDEKLQDLLKEFHPESCEEHPVHPERRLEKILYFDFPGQDESSWKKIYQALEQKEKFENDRLDSKVYAHFFIHEDFAAKAAARYELVVQYWLFYPFNDGGNNHEGDWEHINVRLTTLQRRGGFLAEDDLIRIFDHANTAILDSLIIKKVDYYFHHFVMTLDYHALGLDFHQPDKRNFMSELRQAKQRKLRQDWLYERIYERIHLLKDSLNTHPIGYIGADNIGLDQLIALPGGRNRNSHGTYPFPGVWKRVGPAGATERVADGWHQYKFLLPTAAGKKLDLHPRRNPWYEGKRNDQYTVYTEKDIILLPDWEALKDSVLTNAAIRRRWAWLILPIRWGFPVAGSLGAGLIKFKHADLGNSAPCGPAFNPGWNRVSATAGYQSYDPHILPVTFLSGVQDNFFNVWGFFNVPRLVVNFPPANILHHLGLGFSESTPKYLPREDLPFRFTSAAYRSFYTIGDNDFARLLPGKEHTGIGSFLNANPNTKIDIESLEYKRGLSFLGAMYNIHLGRFSGENTFSISESNVRYRIRASEQELGNKVEGTLRLYELTGSFRHSFSKGIFQPFIRTGYGWNLYQIENLTLNGAKLTPAKTKIFHKPTRPFLPNTWHFGAGIELFFEKNQNIWKLPLLRAYAGKPELGIRLDYTLHLHRLGKGFSDELGVANIARQEIGFGLVLGL